MVKKVLRFLYRETSTLHQAAYLLGLFAILSQVLAFLRDRLLAHIFGASQSLDIYYAAFRIPDFIFVTVASVVSISVLVPFIVEREKEGTERVRVFVDNIFSFFSLLIFGTCIAAFLLIPTLSEMIFPGFSPEAQREAALLSRLLLLSPIALGFSNLLGSITQAYNRFTVYALAPILYNIGIIIGVIFLAPRYGVLGVAIGVVFGAFLHMFIQVPFVWRTGLFPRARLRIDVPVIRKVMFLSLPRTLTLSTSYIATFFLVSLASLMAAGSISVFSFAMNLQSVPLSIIGVSYSLAAFPTLSRHFRNKDTDAFIAQMATTARHIIFWTLPITTLFVVLRAQIVRVLLGTGNFDWNDTRLTAALLALFVISSVFQCLLLLFIRGYYSAGYTKKPFLINLASMILIMVSSYALVEIFYAWDTFRYFINALLKVEDLPGTAVLMLPLGYSFSIAVNSLLYWIFFEKDFPGFSRAVGRTFFQASAASIIAGTGAYVGLNLFQNLFNTNSLIGIFFQGASSGVLGIIAGTAVLILLGNKELRETWAAFRAKFWKSKVIATDPEIV